MWQSFIPTVVTGPADWLFIHSLCILLALALDFCLGEPKRFHPLIGFGNLAGWLERQCRQLSFLKQRNQGRLAWLTAVIPLLLLTGLLLFLAAHQWLVWLVLNTFILYLTLGGKSLLAHAEAIRQPLQVDNTEQARAAVAMIVSRNSEQMDKQAITSAAIESVLENGNDAVVAPLVWFAIFGALGALLLRLTNTLDAMWGYPNDRYIDFGRFAAIIDDVLGFIPARLCALFYAVFGNSKQAFACWHRQAKDCASPNGGVVMTAGAGALNVVIGGAAVYFGVRKEKPLMGCGDPADWRAIAKACQLVVRTSWGIGLLWFVVCFVAYVY
jgi:adenosylcobinamide-phosphate synthase